MVAHDIEHWNLWNQLESHKRNSVELIPFYVKTKQAKKTFKSKKVEQGLGAQNWG